MPTSGGLVGILCGTGIGMGVNEVTGFPVSMPWWSFALGVGFSMGGGVLFGMMRCGAGVAPGPDRSAPTRVRPGESHSQPCMHWLDGCRRTSSHCETNRKKGHPAVVRSVRSQDFDSTTTPRVATEEAL